MQYILCKTSLTIATDSEDEEEEEEEEREFVDARSELPNNAVARTFEESHNDAEVPSSPEDSFPKPLKRESIL